MSLEVTSRERSLTTITSPVAPHEPFLHIYPAPSPLPLYIFQSSSFILLSAASFIAVIASDYESVFKYVSYFFSFMMKYNVHEFSVSKHVLEQDRAKICYTHTKTTASENICEGCWGTGSFMYVCLIYITQDLVLKQPSIHTHTAGPDSSLRCIT